MNAPAKYTDYYGQLSYKDFLARQADGTLDSYEISARTAASTETFGLPVQASHLIGKLRNMSPELLAAIRTTQDKAAA